MPKKVSSRSLKAHRTYTVLELAEPLDVTVGTVRAWTKQGLRTLSSKRPILIVGSDAKEFLDSRKKPASRQLHDNEFHCLGCGTPVRALGDLVDCTLQSETTARLSAICFDCEKMVCRMISRADLASFERVFDISYRDVSAT